MADDRRRSAADRVLGLMPVDAVVRRVDVQAIIDRVDIDALLDRVDIDRLLRRVDIDALLARIDVNAIVGRVDVEDIVAKTELGDIVVQSTTSLATKTLDALRSQGVGLDQWMNRGVDRILRRAPGKAPAGPRLLVTRSLPSATPSGES